jgi:hypothetical protein
MDETKRKKQLVERLKSRWPFLVVLRHEDLRTAGIPDISVSRGRTTLWIEVKFGKKARTTGIQYEMIRQLDGVIVRYGDDDITVIEDAKGDEVYRGRVHDPVLEIVLARLL